MAPGGAQGGHCSKLAASIMDLQQCLVLRTKLETGAMAVDMRLGLHGRTMLHVAVLLLRPDLVELLLEFNADPLLEDSQGASPHALALGLRLAMETSTASTPSPTAVLNLSAILELLEYPVAVQTFWDWASDCDVAAENTPPPAPLLRLGSADADQPIKHDPRMAQEVKGWCLRWLQEEDKITCYRTPRHCPLQRQEMKCQICLEVKEGQEGDEATMLHAPCGMSGCPGVFCQECLSVHVQTSVGDLRYAVPVVRCPVPQCRSRIPLRVWAPLVSSMDQARAEDKILQAGQALMTVRCPGCHNSKVLMAQRPAAAESGTMSLQDCSTRHLLAIVREAEQFRRGASANALLDVLAGDLQEAAEPHNEYPRAAPLQLLPRIDELCGLLCDVERMVALRLAYYRRYPLIKTPCCGSDMCFRCKVRGHHEGKTCLERQAEEAAIDAQSCPGCGVPTVKSEGCNSIICVCGTNWSWKT